MNLDIITPNLFLNFCLIQDKGSIFYFLLNTFSVLFSTKHAKKTCFII